MKDNKKYFILFLFFPLFAVNIYGISISSSVIQLGSGNWNDPAIWDAGRVPVSGDDVTIIKGFTVYIDTWNYCYCNNLILEENSKIIFSSGTGEITFLNAGSGITLSNGAKIWMRTLSHTGDKFYLYTGQDISMTGEGCEFFLQAGGDNSTFDISVRDIKIDGNTGSAFKVYATTRTIITLDTRDVKVNDSVDYSSIFNVSISHPDVVFEFYPLNITVGSNCNFSVIINTENSIANITFGRITVNADANCVFACDVFSSTMNLVMSGEVLPGYILNRGNLYIRGADPSSNPKPDSASTRRNCKITGIYNNSYIQTYGWMRFEHVEVEGVGMWRGMWRTAEKYGICAFELDGSDCEKRLYMYNLNIHSSADSGIYLKSCKRLNKWWYNQGISSCVIHGCVYSGILLENTSKTSIEYCDIYENSGGNVGYGIYLLNSDENTIENNRIHENKIRGIYLVNSNKNLIDSNRVYSQIAEEGISLINSQKNTIINNECYNNPVHGIALESKSKYNYIGGNKCFNNENGGMRVRYESDGNIFVMNISSGNKRTGFTSHGSIETLCVDEVYKDNAYGDIYIEGEQNQGRISQIWLKNCLLGSTTEFTNTPEKQEFTKNNSWVISQKHDNQPGITQIWGQFSFPQEAHAWHTEILKWNYSEFSYGSGFHGWNTTVEKYDTPMLRYDDGGFDGEGGGNDITSITIGTATKSEIWIVSYGYGPNGDQWQVRGTKSGIQKKLLTHDTDYESDGGEVKFRLTHRTSPVSPGEQYVFVTIAPAEDADIRKELRFCDFSDPKYIGAGLENGINGTVEIKGSLNYPTLITNKLAEDKVYDGTNFYYHFISSGSILLENVEFRYLNSNGLWLAENSPVKNTDNLSIKNIEPGASSRFLTLKNIIHTFDSIILDTVTIPPSAVYGVFAENSVITFRDYKRPSLNDLVDDKSIIYWDPTLSWTEEEGFEKDGVSPDIVERMGSAEFRIKYTDLGITPDNKGHAPTKIQVWVDLNDDKTYQENEKFNMSLKPSWGNNGNYTDGEIYYCVISSIQYYGDGIIAYRFYAENPYSVTVPTTIINTADIYNSMLTLNEASGQPTRMHTFTVKGTAPRITIETPTGKQSGLVTITYRLIDDDGKEEPHNFCKITPEYYKAGAWLPATIGPGSEPTENLKASTGTGTVHIFIWDTMKDIPYEDITTSFRITPEDEDGKGNTAMTMAFQVDNIVVSKLVFTTQPQELLVGNTSQIIVVEGQDMAGNRDYHANLLISLTSDSNNYSFVSSTSNTKITQVQMTAGRAEFRYRDQVPGNPTLTASAMGLLSGNQSCWVTRGINISSSTVVVDGPLTYTVGSTVTVRVTLVDDYGAGVPNKQVTISVSGSNNIITQPEQLSNASGICSAKFYSTKAEPKLITATNVTDRIPLISSTTVIFTPDIVSPEVSTFYISTASTFNEFIVGTTATITIVLRDKFGNPVPGKEVVIQPSVIRDKDVITNPSVLTDTNGVVTAKFYSETAEEKIITVFDKTDSIMLAGQLKINYFGVMDYYPPYVYDTYPKDGAKLIGERITQAWAVIYDSGSAGVKFSSCTIKLYRGDGTEISGTKSIDVVESKIILSFSELDYGDYALHVTPCDNNNLIGETKISSFSIVMTQQEAKEMFIKSVYAYPNPAKDNIRINYTMQFDGIVSFKLYNMLGEVVYEEERHETSGENKTFLWNGLNAAGKAVGSGVYIYKLAIKSDDGTTYETKKKVVFVK